jgi:hypothetical protein
MHGYYAVIEGDAPRLAPGLAQATSWGSGRYEDAVEGGPWRIMAPQGYIHVEMDGPCSAGSVIGRVGVETDKLAGCLVIAAMQHDGAGRWQRYYFAHVTSDKYSSLDRADEFRAAITHSARAFLLIANQGWLGIDDVVPAVQQWANPPMPNVRTTVYAYLGIGQTFGMQLNDGSVGQFNANWA